VIACFYTYIHMRADDGLVFYVGKGKGKRATQAYGRSSRWQRIKELHGVRVEIVASNQTELEAFEMERALIARYRAENQPLCNHTDGGEGPCGYRHTEETLAVLSAKKRGRKLSAEHRAQLSEALKLRSQESFAKISAALRGHSVSAETRAKISASRIGIKPSAHAIAMVKAANTGRIRSSEFRAKVSAVLQGRHVSEETRKKISAAQRGRVVSQEMRTRISATLTGRRLSDEEKERRRPLTHGAEWRAKHSAAMKGRPWSEARRAAQEGRSRAGRIT
jgi:hypothetical protein